MWNWKPRLQWLTIVEDAYSVTATTDNEEFIVVNDRGDHVFTLRAADGAIVRTVGLRYQPMALPQTIVVTKDLILCNSPDCGDIEVLSGADGALLRRLPIPLTPSWRSAMAMDTKRDLLYAFSYRPDSDATTVSVYRASSGVHVRDVAVPLPRPQWGVQLIIGPAGELIVVAPKRDVDLHVLVYESGGGDDGQPMCPVLKRTDVLVRPTVDFAAAIDVRGDLLYFTNFIADHYCVAVLRLSDGRLLGTLDCVCHVAGLVATSTALVMCDFGDDTVMSLQLPARLSWRPDASVHALFGEDEDENGGQNGGVGGDGRRFHRAVGAVLSLAACRCGSVPPPQLARLPLELLCLVCAQLAPVVLEPPPTP